MKNQYLKRVLLIGGSFLLGSMLFTGFAAAQETKSEDAQESVSIEETIKNGIDAYEAAFNSHDAEQVAAHWAVGGVYTTEPGGEQIVGRELIQKEVAELFAAGASRKLSLETQSVDLISPSVALVTGIATAKSGDEDPIVTEFRTIYVLRDGTWLIDRLTEDESSNNEEQNEKLQPIQWIIGQWKDDVDGRQLNIDANWSANNKFITRAFAIYDSDKVEASGLEVIGWDPKQKKIRSWMFDSDGAVVRGTWTQAEDRWIVQSVATLADGAMGSYTRIYRPFADGSYGWQKINQVVDGEVLPNLDEVIISRKQISESEQDN